MTRPRMASTNTDAQDEHGHNADSISTDNPCQQHNESHVCSEKDTKSESRIKSKLNEIRTRQKDFDEINSMTAKHSQLSSTNLDCRSHLSTNSIDTNRLTWTANEYKNAGNKLCSLYRYEEALIYYNKAISKDPEVASYYSNRALCHLKLQQWTQTTQDCRRALEIDSNSIKAHFFLGQALAELGNYDDSLKHLQKAHELAKINKMNFGDDITYQIRLMRRRRWSKIEHDNEVLEDQLHLYLMKLIDKDRENNLKETNRREDTIEPVSMHEANIAPLEPTASTSAQYQDQSSHGGTSAISPTEQTLINSTNLDCQQTEMNTNSDDYQTKCDKYKIKLESIFQNLKQQRKRREVPDYLCGKISFELMRDPVITPSGITYDRQDIDEHLKRVGHFDPITRQPLKASQLISNLAMKEVVDAYLKDNEWALYY